VGSVTFLRKGWMEEANPIAKKIYRRWGGMGLIVFKVTIVASAVVVTWIGMFTNPLLSWIAVGLGTLIGLVPYRRLFLIWYWFYWRRDNL